MILIPVSFTKIGHPQSPGKLFDDVARKHAIRHDGHIAHGQKGQISKTECSGKAEDHRFGQCQTLVYQQVRHHPAFTVGEMLMLEMIDNLQLIDTPRYFSAF